MREMEFIDVDRFLKGGGFLEVLGYWYGCFREVIGFRVYFKDGINRI